MCENEHKKKKNNSTTEKNKIRIELLKERRKIRADFDFVYIRKVENLYGNLELNHVNSEFERKI